MKRQRRSVKIYGVNTQFCQRLVFVFLVFSTTFNNISVIFCQQNSNINIFLLRPLYLDLFYYTLKIHNLQLIRGFRGLLHICCLSGGLSCV